MAERLEVYKCEACGNVVLVLEGGGVKGVAYAGSLAVLEAAVFDHSPFNLVPSDAGEHAFRWTTDHARMLMPGLLIVASVAMAAYFL